VLVASQTTTFVWSPSLSGEPLWFSVYLSFWQYYRTLSLPTHTGAVPPIHTIKALPVSYTPVYTVDRILSNMPEVAVILLRLCFSCILLAPETILVIFKPTIGICEWFLYIIGFKLADILTIWYYWWRQL
jgi:hypothetical protein